MTSPTAERGHWKARRGWREVAVVGALLAGGLFLRLPSIDEPSTEQRETQSALLARQWYRGSGSELPEWKQRVLREVDEVVKPIEPPFLEYAASLQFRLVGENFWFPRLLASLFWVAGGVFLYLIAGRLTSREGALIALTLFLVWPYGVWLSRHFMPDSMLVAFLLASSLSVLRYWERPSQGRFVLAGLVSAAAVAVKPGVAFLFVLFLFGALALTERTARTALARTLAFAALAASVTGVYYVIGTYASDFIWSEAGRGRLTLDLVVTERFWSGWWSSVSYLLRYPQAQGWLALLPLVAGAAGFLAAPSRRPRAILAGLAAGYVAFGLAFANYTSGNPYYSLPLLPILALSIGVLGGRLLQQLRPAGRVALLAAFALLAGVAAIKSHSVLDVKADRARIADYRRIGELTNHTTRALVVDPELSTPLMYWGWVVGKSWELDYPRPPRWIHPERADFLIVVDTSQFDSSSGLRAFARGRHVVARTSRYAIFDLRTSPDVNARSG